MALLRSRTPQGATAWVMSLLSFPFVSVPLYIIFGRNKFEGYNIKRRILDSKVQNKFDHLQTIQSDMFSSADEIKLITQTVASDNQPGFTRKNSIKLLINAKEAFPEMLEAIENAKKYIIFQFYIIRDDLTGRKFIDVLIKKAHEGVRITLMNDAVGVEIPRRLLKKMKEAGIQVGTFNESTTRGKFQINFRNHRKILIVDGKVAFLGGLNIGDEYQGITKEYGPWRDTNVRLEGPSVIAAQLGTAKDWYCIQEKELDADWEIVQNERDVNVMVLNTGPADEKHSCLLSFVALINAAEKRLWIANPYFVPPESLMDAILLASLRGVDVRLLIPSYSDSRTILVASEIYQKVLLKHGVKVFRYTQGFLHQKVMVIDEDFGVVGSVNFDCRSMFINFEVSAIAVDKNFANDLARMLEQDFSVSEELTLANFEHISLFQNIISRGANLMAPIL